MSRIAKLYVSSPGEGNSNPLQYSCLEIPMDRGDWWAIVHRVAKSQTRLNDFTFTFMQPRSKVFLKIVYRHIYGTDAIILFLYLVLFCPHN